ncbi:unnamed protein product [Cochlearia groenlandica]
MRQSILTRFSSLVSWSGTGGGSIAIHADATVKVDCELSAFEEEVQKSTRARLIEHVFATSANTGGKGSYNKENMLLVKNIPLEVTKKELRQVSSPYGQIKSVKLPKTDDNSEVRCGFIEFATMYEAFHAKKALSCTHLYGRLLMVDWVTKPPKPSKEIEMFSPLLFYKS